MGSAGYRPCSSGQESWIASTDAWPGRSRFREIDEGRHAVMVLDIRHHATAYRFH